MFVMLTLAILVLRASALHIAHKQNVPRYNATNYLSQLQSRQQQFNTDIALIKQEIDNISKILNSSTLTADQQLTTLSQGMADQRDSLYNIQSYLYYPSEIQPCKQVNLTVQQRQQLQSQIDKVNISLVNLQAQVDFCPQCPQIQQVKAQILKQYNYLKAIQATVHSGCLQRPYTFINQSATGIANIANSLYKDNLKGSNWVYGNITQSDYKLYIFRQSTQYNLTSCPAVTPYVDYTYKYCTSCHGIYSIGQRVCKPCPNGTHFNTSIKNCEEDQKICPNGTFLNKTNNKCQAIICNQGFKYDTNVSKCVTICKQNEIFNSSAAKCQTIPVKCSQGYHYNLTTRKCQPVVCADGFVFNTTTKQCQVILCSNGYFYNLTTKKCEIIVCSNNQIYHIGSKKCINKIQNTYSLCPPDRPMWNASVFQCQICPTASPIFNNLLKKCQSCNNNQVYNKLTNKCQSLCSQNQVYNQTSKKCQLNCPQKQVYNETLNSCQCIDGLTFNPSTKNCQVYCPQGQYYNFGSKTCQIPCPTGQYYNKTSRFCQSPLDCNTGQTFNQYTGLCESRCPTGQVYNPSISGCQIKCKPNSYLDHTKNQCICNVGYISNGTDCLSQAACTYPTPILNVQANKCQPCPSQKPNYSLKLKQCVQPCQTAYVWNNQSSICILKICNTIDKPILSLKSGQCQACPSNSSWNSTTRVCQSTSYNYSCQPGFFFNAATQKCQTTICPTGYHFNQGNNKCQRCPDGSYYNQTIGKCYMCPNGTIFNPQTKLCKQISCGFNQYYSAKNSKCIFVPSCQSTNKYYSIANESCVDYPDCGDFYILNKTTRSCQPVPPCSSGMYYNKKTSSCQRADFLTSPNSSNLIWFYDFKNYTSQYEAKKISDTYARDCPAQAPYADLNNKVCVICPKQTPYFNLHTSLCQSCGDSGYDQATKRCKNSGVSIDPTLQRLIMNIL